MRAHALARAYIMRGGLGAEGLEAFWDDSLRFIARVEHMPSAPAYKAAYRSLYLDEIRLTINRIGWAF